MTPSQQILLTAAIGTAKAVEGYNDPAKTELAELRTAVENAEKVLAEDEPKKDAAQSALDSINAALKAQKVEEITEYNTLTQTLPVTSEIYDVVYSVEYPAVPLGLEGKTGETALKVVVLTKNGILATASKNLTIYAPVDEAYLYTKEDQSEQRTEITDITVTEKVGSVVNADIRWTEGNYTDEEKTNGGFTGSAENFKPAFGETVAKFTWASENPEVASVSPGSNGACTIVPNADGSAVITVSVETNRGNTYTAKLNVTIDLPETGA